MLDQLIPQNHSILIHLDTGSNSPSPPPSSSLMLSNHKSYTNSPLKFYSPPSPAFSSPSPPPISSPSSSDLPTSSKLLDGFQVSLDSIIDLNSLIHFETSIIRRLASFHTAPAQASQARKRIQDFRRQVVQKHYPITPLTSTSTTCPATRTSSTTPTRDWSDEILNEEIHHHQPFDRLIYLLQRYIEHCDSIGLPPWPIHHLKVAIWIRGDVISLKTRVVPLRKTVRCYITSLEKVRVMTFDIFPHHPSEGDDKMLMSSLVLREILDQLPINRSTSNLTTTSKHSNDSTPNSLSFLDSENSLDGSDRNSIVDTLRAQSGDAQASEALSLVRHARGRAHGSGFSEAIVTKLKPDPHLHTLQRFQSWASELGIPAWPIEPLRVSIWLKQSVLVPGNGPSDGDRHTFKVSLRTVQVYLSRLEFARSRTESLFRDRFGAAATTSLYRSQAIIDILESFPTSRSYHSNTMSLPSPSGAPIPMDEHQCRPSTASSTNETRLVSPSDTRCTPRKRRRGYSAATTDGDRSVVRAVGFQPIRHEEVLSVYETEDSRACSHHENQNRRRATATSHLSKESDLKSDQLPTENKVVTDEESHHQMPPRKKVDKGCISFILCDNEDQDTTADKMAANGQSSKRAYGHFSGRSLTSPENNWTVSPLSIPRSSRATQLLSSASELRDQKPRCCIPSFSQFIQASSRHLQ